MDVEDRMKQPEFYKMHFFRSLLAFVVKYRASLFARFSFFIKDSSAIGSATAIILYPSFGLMLEFGRSPALRAGAGAAVVDKGY